MLLGRNKDVTSKYSDEGIKGFCAKDW